VCVTWLSNKDLCVCFLVLLAVVGIGIFILGRSLLLWDCYARIAVYYSFDWARTRRLLISTVMPLMLNVKMSLKFHLITLNRQGLGKILSNCGWHACDLKNHELVHLEYAGENSFDWPKTGRFLAIDLLHLMLWVEFKSASEHYKCPKSLNSMV